MMSASSRRKLAAEDYERLRGAQNPHRAYLAGETPDVIADLLRDEIDALGDADPK